MEKIKRNVENIKGETINLKRSWKKKKTNKQEKTHKVTDKYFFSYLRCGNFMFSQLAWSQFFVTALMGNLTLLKNYGQKDSICQSS